VHIVRTGRRPYPSVHSRMRQCSSSAHGGPIVPEDSAPTLCKGLMPDGTPASSANASPVLTTLYNMGPSTFSEYTCLPEIAGSKGECIGRRSTMSAFLRCGINPTASARC